MIRIAYLRASGTLVFGAGRDNGPGAVAASVPDRWRFFPDNGDTAAVAPWTATFEDLS